MINLLFTAIVIFCAWQVYLKLVTPKPSKSEQARQELETAKVDLREQKVVKRCEKELHDLQEEVKKLDSDNSESEG